MLSQAPVSGDQAGLSRACGAGGRLEAGGAGPTRLLLPQILAALPMDWRGPHLLACACLRVIFIPLFILCVYPSGAPALRHPAWPCVFSLLMGISNGYFGSAPMILAAGKVRPGQRELAGRPLGRLIVGLAGRAPRGPGPCRPQGARWCRTVCSPPSRTHPAAAQ